MIWKWHLEMSFSYYGGSRLDLKILEDFFNHNNFMIQR